MNRREYRRMQLNALRRTAPTLLLLRYSEMAADSPRRLPSESKLSFSAMIETMLDLEEEQFQRQHPHCRASL
jgi:hypothetical protein